MQLELPAIHVRKEILAQPGDQENQRDHAHGKENSQETAPVMEAQFQQFTILFPEALERFLKANLHPNQRIAAGFRQMAGFLLVPSEQVLCHRRDQRPRKQVRGQHGKYHRFGHRNKQVSRHAGQKKHWNKHDADGQGRHERRNCDLLRTVENRLLNLLALSDVSIDVLDLHRGVIHQYADRQGQTSQRHDVDGLAQRAEHDEGCEDREWDRDRNNNSAPPISEEDQDHEPGQAGSKNRFLKHPVYGSTYK